MIGTVGSPGKKKSKNASPLEGDLANLLHYDKDANLVDPNNKFIRDIYGNKVNNPEDLEIDKRGHLRDEDGNMLRSADGNILRDENGNLRDKDGN
jgi:hypothetical protein